MFWLIRIIFILSLLGMAYCGVKWHLTQELRWQRHFRNLLRSTIAFAFLIVIILFITRILR
jgi:tellurite resistance protein TehA-like permease